MTALLESAEPSLLAAPLLFRSAPAVHGSTASRAPIVHYKSPSEFLERFLSDPTAPRGGSPESAEVDESSSRVSIRSSSGTGHVSSACTGEDHTRPPRLTQKWTIAVSRGEAWHALTTDRLGHVMHMWSLLTASLVRAGAEELASATACFFPAPLPNVVARGDSVYREVRSRIPIQLLHSSIPTNAEHGTAGDDDSSDTAPDTLVEFLRTRRMYARRLRALLHDGVLGILSHAPSAWGEERDGLSTSNALGGLLSQDGPVEGTRCRAMHRLLPFAFADTVPVVWGVQLHKNGPDPKDVALELRFVARLRADSAAAQSPASTALHVLSQTFPVRFAVQGAERVEVAELDASGCVQLWHCLAPSTVLKAQRMVDERAFFQTLSVQSVPTSAPLSLLSPGGSRVQHDPYARTAAKSNGVSQNCRATENGEERPTANGCVSSVSSFSHTVPGRLDSETDIPSQIRGTTGPSEENEDEELRKGAADGESVRKASRHAATGTPRSACVSAEADTEAKDDEATSEEALLMETDTETEVIDMCAAAQEMMALAKELTESRGYLAELRALAKSTNNKHWDKKKEVEKNGVARRQKGRTLRPETELLYTLLDPDRAHANAYKGTPRADEAKAESSDETEEHVCAAAAAVRQLDLFIRAELTFDRKRGVRAGEAPQNSNQSHSHRHRHRGRHGELPFLPILARSLRPHSHLQPPAPAPSAPDGPFLLRCAASRRAELLRCVDEARAAMRAAAAAARRHVAALSLDRRRAREVLLPCIAAREATAAAEESARERLEADGRVSGILIAAAVGRAAIASLRPPRRRRVGNAATAREESSEPKEPKETREAKERRAPDAALARSALGTVGIMFLVGAATYFLE